MIRQVYSLPSASTAQAAVAALRGAGFTEEHISLAARHDIELERLPEAYAEETHDFNGGLKRGLVFGGGTGLLAGLVAASIPSFGVTLAGAALMGLAGVALGGWSSALVGTTVPSDLRRDFEEEIEQGRVVLAVKVAPGDESKVIESLAFLGEDARLLLQDNGRVAA
jgi:hypothetical protein